MIRSLFCAAATAAALTAAVPLASGSVDNRFFALTADRTSSLDHARGTGKVTFPNTRTFRAEGRIDDVCGAPKAGDDTRGAAYIAFSVLLRGEEKPRGMIRSDREGCRERGVPFKITGRYPQVIGRVRVCVFEADPASLKDYVAGVAAARCKDYNR